MTTVNITYLLEVSGSLTPRRQTHAHSLHLFSEMTDMEKPNVKFTTDTTNSPQAPQVRDGAAAYRWPSPLSAHRPASSNHGNGRRSSELCWFKH